MKLASIISSLLLLAITSTSNNTENEPNIFEEKYEEATHTELKGPIAIDDIVIYEVEEEADICFDTTKYLPENFNALKGKHDIDWSKIDLVDEPEDELVFAFDTAAYLPEGFDAHKTVSTVKSTCTQSAKL